MVTESVKYLKRDDLPALAYRYLPASGQGERLPPVLFCSGFRSDMEGTKALFLEESCRRSGQAFIRFDYSGHGQSEGVFEDGTISAWLEDTLAIIDHVLQKPFILVGSSMGGWIGLRAAQERPGLVHGMIGIAAAPDFTQDIYDQEMSDDQRAIMAAQGYIDVPNDYSPTPYRITRALIEDGRKHLLLDRPLTLDMPLLLIQGMQDTDVPWQKAYRIKNAMKDESLAEVFPVESGDHRLSRPEDLALLETLVKRLSTTDQA